MHESDVVVHCPPQATQLVLLFHGVGSSAANLAPLGEAIANALPGALVVSVNAPHASTLGSGHEWFSVVGITEQDRPARIAQAMPLFQDTIAYWQQKSGVGPAATTLVGFSQGAIMSLEATQMEGQPSAGRVIALAGRFAMPVRRMPGQLHFHLIHGEADPVVPASFSASAAQALRTGGAMVTLDLIPNLGHAIDARVLERLLGYLR
ncbi:esterase [Comamonas phosphati]|nr:esterase [Comamonas phosphati]